MPDVHDAQRLKELQALPLDRKVRITQTRIIEWVNYYKGKAYVSFSGGKDSTVLLHIARTLFPEIPAVFSNTGLEYPEIQKFAQSFDNVNVVRPRKTFIEVLKTEGYPLISKEVSEAIYYARRNTDGRTPPRKQRELLGNRTFSPATSINPHLSIRRSCLLGIAKKNKTGGVFSDVSELSAFNKKKWLPLAEETPFRITHKCCSITKKSPVEIYCRAHKEKPIIGTLATESRLRRQAWLKHGCNAFHDKQGAKSQPMSFWTEQDVLEYIYISGIPICSVYGEIEKNDSGYKCSGCQRTGCIYCAYGFHLEREETRFERLKKTHPRQYEYCLTGGEWTNNPDYDSTISSQPDEFGWVPWNPKRIWVPNKSGLGMAKIFDMCNDIYGKDFYRY